MEAFEAFEKLPLYIKAMEILKLVDHIVETVEHTEIEIEMEYQEDMVESNLQYLRENILIIPAKIAGAAHEDTIYDLKMENAAIIRKAARELITDVRGLQIIGFKDIEYLDLL